MSTAGEKLRMKVTADLINSIKIDEKIKVGRTVTMSIFIKEKVMH